MTTSGDTFIYALPYTKKIQLCLCTYNIYTQNCIFYLYIHTFMCLCVCIIRFICSAYNIIILFKITNICGTALQKINPLNNWIN